jgi:uncharacterized protein (DUF169 family)
MSTPPLAGELVRLLDLPHPPVAVRFHAEKPPPADAATAPDPEPAGCCFWAKAETAHLVTTADDHAHCSVGSYTHGFISLTEAAAGADTAALIGSGWVAAPDFLRTPAVDTRPGAISYQPLNGQPDADVVLIRLTARSLMSLQAAWPELSLVTKPQCQIVPLAMAGAVAVSPGCAVSRVRTGLPADELTCAIPAAQLPALLERLERSRMADEKVSAFAAADLQDNYSRI